MRRISLLVMIFFLVGCISGGDQVIDDSNETPGPNANLAVDEARTQSSPALESQAMPTLTNLGPAPELTNQVWLNTPEPLRLADLKGRVVLLEMWTFG